MCQLNAQLIDKLITLADWHIRLVSKFTGLIDTGWLPAN